MDCEPTVSQATQQMIDIIPDGEKLKERLISFKDKIFLELPERNNHLWKELLCIIQKHTPPGGKDDLNEWQLQVALILRGEAMSIDHEGKVREGDEWGNPVNIIHYHVIAVTELNVFYYWIDREQNVREEMEMIKDFRQDRVLLFRKPEQERCREPIDRYELFNELRSEFEKRDSWKDDSLRENDNILRVLVMLNMFGYEVKKKDKS